MEIFGRLAALCDEVLANRCEAGIGSLLILDDSPVLGAFDGVARFEFRDALQGNAKIAGQHLRGVLSKNRWSITIINDRVGEAHRACDAGCLATSIMIDLDLSAMKLRLGMTYRPSKIVDRSTGHIGLPECTFPVSTVAASESLR